MNYKKMVRDKYNIHVIDSDRFKSTVIQIILAKEFDKEDIAYGKLLKSILVYSTKKYNSKSKMVKKIEDLYGINLVSGFSIVGNLEFLEFNLEFLNPKYTDEKTRDESIEVLLDVIFNPNVKDECFSEEVLEILKKEAITEYRNIILNPRIYSSGEYNKLMFKGTPLEHSVYSNEEDINNVDVKSLYKFYKKLFNGNYKLDIIFHGENSEELVPLVEKRFKDIKTLNSNLDIFVKSKPSNKVIEKEDCLPFAQSKVYLGYRVKDYIDEKDYYTFRVFNMILGSMNNSVLFDTVREKNSLCYNISSYINRFNTSLTVYSGINKDNKEKALEIIKECVASMKNKALVDNMIDAARHNIETSLNSFYDDLVGQINNYYMNEFTTVLDVESYRKKLLDVTSDEIVEFAKRIYLSAIYFMKGDLE